MLLNAITKALNTYLKLDPDSTERLEKLDGKVVGITLLPLQLSFQCLFSEGKIEVVQNNLLHTDTHITGTPLQMLGMAISRENRQHFFAEDIHIDGDAEVGQQVIELFDRLYIDWEEQLSHIIGDVGAHHFGNAIRGVTQWLKHTNASLTQNVSDYIQEEKLWTPTREALEDFFNDIDTLRMDVDRAEIRLQHLINKEQR